MHWIRSAGGPLICVEERLADSWSGNVHKRAAGFNDGTDYDRACCIREYIAQICLPGGTALVINDMPLETAIWADSTHGVFIVRIFYADNKKNIEAWLAGISSTTFDDAELVPFECHSDQVVIFDAACPGSCRQAQLSFELRPGKYKIRTVDIEAASRMRLLLHLFAIEM